MVRSMEMGVTLTRSMSWIGLCQFVSVVLQFGASVVLARYLTPYEMGIYAVATAIVGLLALVQAFGLQSMIVREEHLTPEIARTAFTINALGCLALSSGIALLSLAGGAMLGDDRVRTVMLGLAINPWFGIFDFLPAAQLERSGRFKLLALTGIVCGLVAALVTIGGAMAGANYMTAVYAGWASAATFGIIVNVAGREHVRFRPSVTEWRRTATFGLQMLATSGLHSLGGRLSDLCLGKLQGLGALGIYGRAGTMNGLIWNNIHLALGRVMFVEFADLHRQGRSLRNRYIVTVDMVTACLWPAFAGLAILAGPLIMMIYGDRWVGAAGPMAMLAISSIILVSITMSWEVFTATGNLATQTRIEFYNAIFSILAFAIGCLFSLTAAAASRIVSSVVTVLIFRPYLSRMTGTTTADLTPIYVRSGVLTAVAVAPAATLMLYYGFAADVPTSPVLAAVALGMALWVGALVACRHPLVEEIRKLSFPTVAAPVTATGDDQ